MTILGKTAKKSWRYSGPTGRPSSRQRAANILLAARRRTDLFSSAAAICRRGAVGMSPGGNARGEQARGLFTAKQGASKQSQGDHPPSKRNSLLCTKRNFSRFGYRVPNKLDIRKTEAYVSVDWANSKDEAGNASRPRGLLLAASPNRHWFAHRKGVLVCPRIGGVFTRSLDSRGAPTSRTS